MLINEFEVKDYKAEVSELITEQFKDKTVFNKYIDLLLAPVSDLQLVIKDLIQNRSIDTAYGEQLDVLGRLVGQPRVLLNADLYIFFGFLGNPQSDSFGSLYIPGVGGVWRDLNSKTSGNVTLDDEAYRLLIKARIAKNVTRATPEDVMEFANFMFSTTGSTISSEGGAHFTLLIGRPLTRVEIGLLKYVNYDSSFPSKIFPKPVGVGMEFGSFNVDKFFAFQGVRGAKGYGGITYSHSFDGEFIFDGSVVPFSSPLKDQNGQEVGGYWATLHQGV